jgi:putative CocE/NonD family hydrolase
MDAGTAEAALARYRSLPQVPMEVWITAHTHVNDRLTDPFFPEASDPIPSLDEQWSSMLAFLGRVRSHESVSRTIHYYVLGAKTLKTTPVWPPADSEPRTMRFGPNGTLSPLSPTLPDGEDHYTVDFTATTGNQTRWSTQLGTPAAYPDRAAEGAKLLRYTSEPLEQDTELVGTPSVTLYVATSTADPAFFAYLEDVAPDGRCTYLTEGLLRGLHRRPADPSSLPYLQSVPAKSFLRKDAQPMVPGEVAEVSFPMFSVAALIKRGHRLRVSLAGADSSMFRRYSDDRPETWIVERTATRPSALNVQLRPWSPGR